MTGSLALPSLWSAFMFACVLAAIARVEWRLASLQSSLAAAGGSAAGGEPVPVAAAAATTSVAGDGGDVDSGGAAPPQATAADRELRARFAALRRELLPLLPNATEKARSNGPLLVRLAWHASGHYDAATRTGGSCSGATMRFAPEAEWDANAGLDVARALLAPLAARHASWLSTADVWQFAAFVAMHEMGGPSALAFRYGRVDAQSADECPPDGRLPDGARDAEHVRDVFVTRMGFTVRDTVALLGAHALGECHRHRSGFEGAWTVTPHRFDNGFYKALLQYDWKEKRWDGPRQMDWNSLMMLPADMAMRDDDAFAAYSRRYADNADAWARDFAAAWDRLVTLGCGRTLSAPLRIGDIVS